MHTRPLFALMALLAACSGDGKPTPTSLSLDTFESNDANDVFDEDDEGDPSAADSAPQPTTGGETGGDPSGPSSDPTGDPSSNPTNDPTAETGSSDPTGDPTSDPTNDPTADPTATSDDTTGQPGVCDPPAHAACDNGTSDPFKAMGIACAGEFSVQTGKTGDAGAIGVRSNFGQTDDYDAREGSQFAVLATGNTAELNTVTPQADPDQGPTHCSDALAGSADPGATLPAPLKPTDVAGDCAANPGLVGTGDCSNSIQSQFSQGGTASDYAELRLTVDVPGGATALAYDLAFFSVEYPYYYGSAYNDMFVAWLESEAWTGNVSFDGASNPISLNSTFFTVKDDAGTDPRVAGTCMRQHGGTPWLTSTVPVTPGETITLVFAVFDMADAILDSYAFLDNFRWSCETPERPGTEPAA